MYIFFYLIGYFMPVATHEHFPSSPLNVSYIPLNIIIDRTRYFFK
jgi:hypothetical protein